MDLYVKTMPDVIDEPRVMSEVERALLDAFRRQCEKARMLEAQVRELERELAAMRVA